MTASDGIVRSFLKPLAAVERLEDRNVPAALSVSNLAGDLVISDTVGHFNDMTMSVAAGNLIITDASEQFDGTGGFTGASLSNGDKTLSIPLTSLAGANVSIAGAAGNDVLTIQQLPGFDSGLSIGSLAQPFGSVSFAGAVSLPAGKNLNVWSGSIAVSGPVSTAGGAIELSATNGITLNEALTSGGGNVTLNADCDANGSGSLTLSHAVLGTLTQQQQLSAADGAADDNFGQSVALSSDGNTAIVGTFGDDVGGNVNQGTATIFTRSGGTWTKQQQIYADGGAANDRFGISVALSSDGNTAIVGAYVDDVGGNGDQGTATIFTRSGGVWTQQQQISADGGAASDSFGVSVALSSDGNTAIVGADQDDVGSNNNQGTATIFIRIGGVWTQQQQIIAFGGAADDHFGFSVALSSDGNTAIVGAFLDDVGSILSQGTATIFTRSGGVWTQEQQISAAGGASSDYFGSSVALSSDGSTAIVGANADGVGANTDQGSATIFTRFNGAWTQQQQISAIGGAANDYFGSSVALSSDGNIAIVGALRDDVSGNIDQGTATIFSRSGATWTQPQQISAVGGTANDWFGDSAALSSDGKTVIVGAYFDDVGGNSNQGTATIFTRAGGLAGGSINAGGGTVAIAAADVDLNGPLSSSSTVSITVAQSARPIDIGGSTSGTLGLTDAELDYISAGTLTVGGAMSGAITVTAAITNLAANNLALISGGGMTVNQPITMAVGKNLSVAGHSIIVEAAVSTVGGTLQLTAANGITIGNVVTSGSGAITIDADSDANGSGELILSAAAFSAWTQQQQVSAQGGAANDNFGYSVALSSDGNTAIVGAYRDDVGSNSDQGTATIFTRSGGVWTQQQQISALGGAASDNFGYSVALSSDGNTALVGAYLDDVGSNADQGTATIFTRSGGVWTQQQQISVLGGAASDVFGNSVALSSDGNTALVGAYLDNVGSNGDQGTATIFTRSGGVWTQRQQISEANGATSDNFGYSVALSSDGNTAIVGAYRDDVDGNADEGTATIFTRSGGSWIQQQQISAFGGAANDRFGNSVALSSDGNTAIIGAYEDDVDGVSAQGTATIFTRSGGVWTQQQQVSDTGGAFIDRFGTSVALSGNGDIAIIGAYWDDVGNSSDQGTATIFTRVAGVWTQRQQIVAVGGAADDYFGFSVALSSDGNTTIVGAYRDDVGGALNQGSATIFTRSSDIDGASINSGAGTVSIAAATVSPKYDTGDEIAAAATSFTSGSDLAIDINNATNFDTLNVAGTVILTGVDLVLTGMHIPAANDVFTIVTSANVIGTFNDKANNSTFTFNGTLVRISYTSSAVTITPLNVLAPTVTGLTPVIGPTTGGTIVLIEGINFVAITDIKVDGMSLATGSFNVNSTSQISVTMPPHAGGPVDIRVTNSVGTGSLAGTADFTYVRPPTVILLTPAAGSTIGGTLVSIIGTDFDSITDIKVGGASLAPGSYTVNSSTQISVTMPPHASGVVDVQVIGAGGAGSLADPSDFTYIDTNVPFLVNGGPEVVLGPNSALAILGQNSVVKQIKVKFDHAVTVAPDAFTVTARTTNVTVPIGAEPSTLEVSTSVTSLSTSEYLVTFSGPGTHHSGIINNGVWDLTTVGSKISVDGVPMNSDQVNTFLALFGTVDAHNTYSVSRNAPTGYTGDGNSSAFVDPGSLFQFSDAFGSNATATNGEHRYNRLFDYNLDGFIDPADLFAFSETFGVTWIF